MKFRSGIFLVSGFVLALPLSFYLGKLITSNEQTQQKIVVADSLFQTIVDPPIPEKVIFAGEEVPLWIDDVRERLERELIINTHWHSNTIVLLKKSPRYFPLFEKIFDSLGVPDDFKYVSLIESRLSNEESPVGAAGLWHLMPISAKEYKLHVDDEIDERYNAQKATVAAAKYFLKAKDKFGTWTNAAASYNRGMGGFKRAIEHQGVSNYYDLKMNPETARYVFRIIAMKLIWENPEAYGFRIKESDKYKPLDTKSVTVSGKIDDWANFAEEHGTIYKYVRIYNPWIKDKKLDNSKNRTYEVLIPKNSQVFGAEVQLKIDSLESESDTL